MMKKWSGPGTTLGSLNSLENAAWEERRRNPQPVSSCDGCLRRFQGFPPDEDDRFAEDEEDDVPEDAGDAFKHCDECDWTICEDCTHPQNQGAL